MAHDSLVQRLLGMDREPGGSSAAPDPSFACGLRGLARAGTAPSLATAPSPGDDASDAEQADEDDFTGDGSSGAGPPLYSLRSVDGDSGACGRIRTPFSTKCRPTLTIGSMYATGAGGWAAEFGDDDGDGDDGGVGGMGRAAAYCAGPCAIPGTDAATAVSVPSNSGAEGALFTDLAGATGPVASPSEERPHAPSAPPPPCVALASEQARSLELRRSKEEHGSGLGVGVTTHIRALAAGAGAGGESGARHAADACDEGFTDAGASPGVEAPTPGDHPAVGRRPETARLPFGTAFNAELLGALDRVVAAARGDGE